MAIPTASLAQRPTDKVTENNDPTSTVNGRANTDAAINKEVNGKMNGHANGPLSIVTASPKVSIDTSGSPTTMNNDDTDAPINEKVNGQMNGNANGHAAPLSTAGAPPKTSVDTSGSSAATNSDDRPVDFTGDVNTNNEIPSQETLKSVEDMPLLDKEGKTVPFKSLYSGPNGTRRVLVIFIRHFFCGVSLYILNFGHLLHMFRLSISKNRTDTSQTELSRVSPNPHSFYHP